jgi:hypothetical protein
MCDFIRQITKTLNLWYRPEVMVPSLDEGFHPKTYRLAAVEVIHQNPLLFNLIGLAIFLALKMATPIE